MAESAAMTAPTEADKDRHVLRWAAVVGVVGVIIGGLIAGEAAYYTAKVQADGQSAEARKDFLRNQRGAAYSKFVGDLESADLYYIDCWDGFNFLDKTVNTAVIITVRKQTTELEAMLGADASAVQFLASTNVSNAAVNLQSDENQLGADCLQQVLIRDLRYPGPKLPLVSAQTNMKKHIDQLNKDENTFQAYGRLDFQH